MQISAFAPEVSKRFRVPSAPALMAKLHVSTPVTFIRVQSDLGTNGWTPNVPPEDAYVAQVLLHDVKDVSLAYKTNPLEIAAAGIRSVFLFDLERCPVVRVESAFDFVRFYFAKESLQTIAAENGWSYRGLSTPPFGEPDAVLHHLAACLCPAFEDPLTVNQLFIDHVALALVSHLLTRFGAGVPMAPGRARGGLSPWQLRRVTDLIESRLCDRVGLPELAAECGLSQSYFARAFRLSLGRAPHRWMLERRVKLAKTLLVQTKLPLSEIAIASGFSDQSHLTKVFARMVGTTPGAWKRENL